MHEIQNSDFACRLCGGHEAKNVFHSENFPKSIWPKGSDSVDEFIPLDAFMCQNCGHLQLSNYEDDYVSTFYEGNVFVLSESCPKAERYKLITQTYKDLDNAGKCIIDVGGGVNSIVQHFPDSVHKSVADYFICDEILQDEGIEKHHGDLTKAPLPNDSFDSIFLFHCLEHINRPMDQLKSLRRALKDDGRLFIEVPDAKFYAEEIPFYLFFHQHLSLFHDRTFESILQLAGFKVEKKFDINGVLFFVAQKSEAKSSFDHNLLATQEILKIYENHMEKIQAKVNGLLEQLTSDIKVSLYGAGGSNKLFYHHFLSQVPMNAAYDQDGQKHGKSLYNGDILILDPQQIKIDRPDLLLFLSPSIFEQMKNFEGVGKAFLVT